MITKAWNIINTADGNAPLTQGRIGLQSEGFEWWYRNWEIRELPEDWSDTIFDPDTIPDSDTIPDNDTDTVPAFLPDSKDGKADQAIRVSIHHGDYNLIQIEVRDENIRKNNTLLMNIIDLKGRIVQSFIIPESANSVDWNLRDSTGNRVRSGLYLFHLSYPGQNEAIRLILP
jgi:hypothetical protein